MSTILCIDDEATILQETVGVLQDEGYDVLQATDGQAGLEAIIKHRPDLVICDVTMPRMDGRELVEKLRQDHPEHAETPFIFLSALASQTDIAAGIDMGADDYLTKPVEFELLLQKINAILRQSKRHQAKREKDLEYLAYHDALTETYNRYYFQQDGVAFLNVCRDQNLDGQLVVVDVNNLKEINDFHGHEAGDQALLSVARTLKANSPPLSIVARIGGDEFAILMSDDGTAEQGQNRILGIPESIEVQVGSDQRNIDVSVSVGLACFPRDGETLNELLQNADLALHRAKRGPTPRVCVFDQEMRHRFNERVQMLTDFRSALQGAEIVPYYQPLVDIATGRVGGLESLARWRHPERGVLTPAVFHEALDDYALSEEVGRQMLELIMHDMASWRATGVEFESVGLNVGESDLLRPGFALDVASGIANHGLSQGDLGIEVTERCVFGTNKELLLQKLQELRSLGCYIALDDFGTGYSSITHLKELPRTAVKIDRQFVKNIVDDKVDQSIVEALVELGRAIGFKLIGEGVEEIEQRDLLEALGCQMAQGYYYSRPVPAEEVPALILRLNGHREAALTA